MSGAVTAAPQPHHLFIRFFLISCNITDRNGAHSILHLFFYYDVAYNTYEKKSEEKLSFIHIHRLRRWLIENEHLYFILSWHR